MIELNILGELFLHALKPPFSFRYDAYFTAVDLLLFNDAHLQHTLEHWANQSHKSMFNSAIHWNCKRIYQTYYKVSYEALQD